MHLGCGRKIVPGFINIDMPGNFSGVKPDLELDISKPLPFADDYADEVHSYHVIEHFYRWEVPGILAEWRRVLKPGGVLVTECPCLDKIRKMLVSPEGHVRRLGFLGLYGDQSSCHPAMVHKWCYSGYELEEILRSIGFDRVIRMIPKTHRPDRDIRFEAVK